MKNIDDLARPSPPISSSMFTSRSSIAHRHSRVTYQCVCIYTLIVQQDTYSMLHPFGSANDLLGLGLILSGDPTGSIGERGGDLINLLKLPRESGWVQERSKVKPVIIRTVILLYGTRET